MTKLKIEALEKIIKAMKAKSLVAKIGIAGGKNAEIGAVHEFGTSKVPQRSFLRTPLQDNLEKYLESAKFTEDDLKDVTKQGSLLPWAEVVAETAKRVIDEGFDTGGFGKWQPDKDGHTPILVETGSLRDSITVVIEEG